MLRGTAVRQRLLAAGLVATCVALQLAGTLHLLVVQHELCLEHGEAIDIGSDHAHGLAVPGAAQARSNASATSRHGSHEAGAHAHCLLVEDRSGRAFVVAPAVEIAGAPALIASVATPGATWSLPANTLRLLAPKTSPPV